jgi:hypothetical protein
MNLEGLDCWDDFPMEHGCICGNDCEPPVRLDPEPYRNTLNGSRQSRRYGLGLERFAPRPGYSQNKEDYA